MKKEWWHTPKQLTTSPKILDEDEEIKEGCQYLLFVALPSVITISIICFIITYIPMLTLLAAIVNAILAFYLMGMLPHPFKSIGEIVVILALIIWIVEHFGLSI